MFQVEVGRRPPRGELSEALDRSIYATRPTREEAVALADAYEEAHPDGMAWVLAPGAPGRY